MTNQTISPCPECGVAPSDASTSNSLCVFGNVVRPNCDHIRSVDTWASDWRRFCNENLGSACRELGIETVEQLKTRLAPDPRVAVLESICEFLARPITIPTYLSARGREYYILDVTEYRSQILKLIAAQRGEGV